MKSNKTREQERLVPLLLLATSCLESIFYVPGGQDRGLRYTRVFYGLICVNGALIVSRGHAFQSNETKENSRKMTVVL